MTQCKKCKNNFIEEILSFKYEDDKKIITHFLSKKSKNSDEEYELKKQKIIIIIFILNQI